MSYSAYGSVFGAPVLRWPMVGPRQQPGSRLWYTYKADGETVLNTDVLESVTIDMKPSGSGEATIGGLIVSGNSISALMIGGVPGRPYTVRLSMTTASAQTFEVLISFPIDPALVVSWPLPPAPSPDFGAALTWDLVFTPVPALFLTVPLNSGVLWFGGQPTGAFVPIPPPPSAIVPSLDFTTPGNSGVLFFGGQPTGAFVPITPPPPVIPPPSLDLTLPLNSSVFWLGGRPTGAFVPL